MSSSLYSQFLREQQAKTSTKPSSLYDQYLAESKQPEQVRGGGSSWGDEDVPARSPRGAFLAPLAEGLTMGGSGEILGAIEGLNTRLHGGSFSEGYERGKQKVADVGKQFASEHPKTSTALEIGGSIAPIIATGGANAVENGLASAARAGAKYGAVSGFLGSDGGLENRAEHALTGAGVGALVAPATSLAGRAIGNIATRTGLTDRVAQAIEKLNPKLGATLGTRGQVNKALSERQDILDALQAPERTAATTQLDRIAATKAQAKQLYDAARADNQAIQHPELSALLQDPQVQRAFEIATQIREATGNPLPKTAAPEQMPAALQKMGVSPERYAELQKLNQNRRVPVVTGTDILGPELTGAPSQGVPLPDPEVLSLLKRQLGMAVKKGANSQSAFTQEQALGLAPKVQRIRDILHEVSPAWKEADAYYADAKGAEDAYNKGYDAVKAVRGVVGKNLAKLSPEALLKEISTPRYASEPAEAIANRAAAFRAGLRAAYADQVRGATTDKGAASVLKLAALKASPRAAQVRAMMFENPADATAFESVLAGKRGAVLKGGLASVPVHNYKLGMIKSVARQFTEPDKINTPLGQQELLNRMLSMSLGNQEVASYRGVSPTAARARNAIRNALAANAAR